MSKGNNLLYLNKTIIINIIEMKTAKERHLQKQKHSYIAIKTQII